MAADLGALYPATYDVRDAAGTLVTPTTIVLTVTLPDQTSVTPTVPAPSPAGHYEVDYQTVQAGRHVVRWATTGPVTAGTDVFDVRPADPGFGVSLADVKAHLNKSSASTVDDAELRRYAEAATAVVVSRVGAGPAVTHTTVLHEPKNRVALPHYPVLSLTSTSPLYVSGATDTVTDLDFDPQTGLVWRSDARSMYGYQRITYKAGRTVAPANHVLAALMIVQHLWESQRGQSGSPRAGGGEETTFLDGFGFSVPNRALELLEADVQGGFA